MTSISSRRKVGHVLGIAVGVVHAASAGLPAGDEGTGPPRAVLAVGAVLGVAVVSLLVLSWRGDARGPRRVAAVLLVLAGLGALPGLLVSGVPAALQVAAGLVILLTIAAVVLLFAPQPASRDLLGAR